MKKRLALVLIPAAVMLCFGMSVYATHGDTNVRARLRGLNEVPPTNSRATATLKATISADETSISFTLDFSGLSGAAGASHIHFGPSKVNGGVMVFFCGGGPQATSCGTGTSGTVTGTLTAADIVGPAAQGIPAAPNGAFADVVRAIRTGHAYANIHTAKFPAGEIRGQLFAFGGDFDDDDGDSDD